MNATADVRPVHAKPGRKRIVTDTTTGSIGPSSAVGPGMARKAVAAAADRAPVMIRLPC